MGTVYVDVLFCVNFVIDYIILLTVRRFMNIAVRRRRLLLGAAAGGLSSFVILLPALPSGLSMLLSFAFACVIVGLSFGPLPKVSYIKTAAAFYLISFGYCGAMMAVLILFSPQSLVIRNGSVYIDISPLLLIVLTIICYVIIRTIIRVTGRGGASARRCSLRICIRGVTTECSAIIDTGSTLCEPFSGEPVIVLSPGVVNEQVFSEGARLVPYSGVGSKGLLRAVRPDVLSVLTEEGSVKINGYIASGNEILADGIQAIIPAGALS